MDFICRFCNENITVVKWQQKGAHLSNCKLNPNKINKSLLCSEKSQAYCDKKYSQLKDKYHKNPKRCKFCKKEIHFINRQKNFCNHSCSAKLNNTLKVRKNNREYPYYSERCKFKFSIEKFNFLFSDQELKLLEYKIYSPKNNKNGFSKDHMLSVNYGFNNNIPEYVLSHVANCSLILQTQNRIKNANIILTLDELIERILLFECKIKIRYPELDRTEIIRKILSICSHGGNGDTRRT